MSLKIPYKDWDDIRKIADASRKKWVAQEDMPISSELALERAGLRLVFSDGLKEVWDIDAAYLHQTDEVLIDSAIYNDPSYFPRTRFTLAHELGHFVMHAHCLKSLSFKNDEDYLAYRRANDVALKSAEYQAHEFAGRFLVPKDILIEHSQACLPKIIEHAVDETSLLGQLTFRLGRLFGVTPQVIKIRLERENLKQIILANRFK